MSHPDDKDSVVPPIGEIGILKAVSSEAISSAEDPAVTAPVIDTRTAIMHALLAARGEATTDKKLLNAEGIVSIAKYLGVDFPEATFTFGNVEAFLKACEKFFREKQYNLLNQAVAYVARGQAALDSGNLPSYAGNEFEEPTQAYVAALELVDKWLDAHKKDGRGVDRKDVNIFKRKCWTDDWKRSVDAAKAVERGVVGKLRDTVSGKETQLGQPTTTHVLLHDAAGKYVGDFPTFDLGSTPLGETPDLARRIIKGTRAEDYSSLFKTYLGSDGGVDPEPSVEIQGDNKSFVNKLFPASKFPDRSLLDGITVEKAIGVIPIAADRPEALFQLYFDGGEAGYQIDIITGENLHRPVVNPRGGISDIGLPSSIGDQEEFFSARAPEILSEARSRQAAEIGQEASTSVLLVITPVVNGAKATFRRKVLHYRMGTLAVDKLAQEILDNPQSENVLILQNSGWITAEQAGEINQALVTEREARASGKRGRPAASIINFNFGGDGDYGGGMKSFGAPMMRGGTGYGTALHTGSSGVGTGAAYGRLQGKLDPDPFARPKILVIQPFGISEHDDPERATDRIASIVDIAARKRV